MGGSGRGSALSDPKKMHFMHRSGILDAAKYPLSGGGGAPGSGRGGAIGASPEGAPERGLQGLGDFEMLRKNPTLLDGLRKVPKEAGKWLVTVKGKAMVFADSDVREVVREVADGMTKQVHHLQACCVAALQVVHGRPGPVSDLVHTAQDLLATAQKQIVGSRAMGRIEFWAAGSNIGGALGLAKSATAAAAQAAARDEQWATGAVTVLKGFQLAGAGAGLVLGFLGTGGAAGAIALGVADPIAGVAGKAMAGDAITWADGVDLIVEIVVNFAMKTKGEAIKEKITEHVIEALDRNMEAILKAGLKIPAVKARIEEKFGMEITADAVEWSVLQLKPEAKRLTDFLVRKTMGVAHDLSEKICTAAIKVVVEKLHGGPEPKAGKAEVAKESMVYISRAVPPALVSPAAFSRRLQEY